MTSTPTSVEPADPMDVGAALAVRAVAATTTQAGPLAPAVLAATVAWLRGRSDAPTTQRAYTADLAAWLDYCADHAVDPLRAVADDLACWADELATLPRSSTGRVLAAASRARTLAAVSSWYDYLLDTGLVVGNPVTVARPVVDRHRAAVAPEKAAAELAAAELFAGKLFAAAAADSGPTAARTRVLVRLLAQVGMPVRDVLAADVDGYVRPTAIGTGVDASIGAGASIGADAGPGRLRVRSRTGRSSGWELPVEVADLLDAYLTDRATRAGTARAQLTGPLLATATGARLDQPAVFRLVRRLARQANLPGADRVSPDSLRPGRPGRPGLGRSRG